eukprot:COSAG01_NODE_140_length_24259_cov_41.225096_25_plen_247_part_00
MATKAYCAAIQRMHKQTDPSGTVHEEQYGPPAFITARQGAKHKQTKNNGGAGAHASALAACNAGAQKAAAEARTKGEQSGRKRREQELRGEYGGALLDVSRDGWERLLTHKQPKRARADEYRDRRGRAKKGPLQPDEWAAPTTQATTHTRDDEGEVEETHACDDVADVAALEYEPGGKYYRDEEAIRVRNEFFSSRESAEHWRRLGIAENDIDVMTGNPVEAHQWHEPQQARRSVEDDEPVVFDYS